MAKVLWVQLACMKLQFSSMCVLFVYIQCLVFFWKLQEATAVTLSRSILSRKSDTEQEVKRPQTSQHFTDFKMLCLKYDLLTSTFRRMFLSEKDANSGVNPLIPKTNRSTPLWVFCTAVCSWCHRRFYPLNPNVLRVSKSAFKHKTSILTSVQRWKKNFLVSNKTAKSRKGLNKVLFMTKSVLKPGGLQNTTYDRFVFFNKAMLQ